jgi:hypothetical protein
MKILWIGLLLATLVSCASTNTNYNHGGTLSDYQQPRYGYQLLDFILPF